MEIDSPHDWPDRISPKPDAKRKHKGETKPTTEQLISQVFRISSNVSGCFQCYIVM